jgi:hypothetical protein
VTLDGVFACRIESRPGTLSADDYRFDTQNLNHTSFECPELHGRIHAYMREFQINFACFDFIVPHEGEPIFLEANCNGQWLWVENLTGMPIGKAIADEFLKAVRPENCRTRQSAAGRISVKRRDLMGRAVANY